MGEGSEYEKLIEKIYKLLDPDSTIRRNDKIFGHKSETHREIDISIRRKIGPHEILCIVQAKDHKRKIDVKAVNELWGVMDDVRASKGILISAKGFSKAAIKLANNLGIDVFSAHDLNSEKWKIEPEIPVLLFYYQGLATINCIFEATQEYADYVKVVKVPTGPPLWDWKISEDNGRHFYTIREKIIFICQHNRQHLDGKERKVAFAGEKLLLFIAEGVHTILKDFVITFKITQKRYYKHFKLKEFQGFIDQNDNKIHGSSIRAEGEDFIFENDTIQNGDKLQINTWDIYHDSTKLIQPYKLECAALTISMPAFVKWESLQRPGQ